MKKTILTLLTFLFLLLGANLGLAAQDLKANANYQRTINYLLIAHTKIYAIGKITDSQELKDKTAKDLPSIEKLLKCAKEAYQLAAPQITDEKMKKDMEETFGVMERCIEGIKAPNEPPSWKMMDYLLYLRIERWVISSANCN